ncbi:NAD(P)-dependent alcohol dehydrogenase [Natrarchaeobius oligotrophus]|uniref:NAD(P)-dependent alcohol dehydrogenase n=1 Tax=Natrarchaeobius chitinivorans TaxID=1679083 RepID=A0A3N6MM36_NATCH|nr:NAD(P)-dependent alcohol dehydrogenase [Natrarchaeobius chitinivorans]RQH02595.1 NAD(P)-dependent alcohol dehydrogenase [Natrarchaeobius chitinivorans]
MRAARLHEYTSDLESAFTIEEIDSPEITAPDDVVVDVEAAGWCHTDNHIVEGEMADVTSVSLPYTPGHENAGVVAATGSEVTEVVPGDAVIVHPPISCGTCRACRLGEDMHCPDHQFVGLDRDGGFAEELKTKERSVIKLESLDPVQAAPHADAGLTAYRAIKNAAGDLVAGDYAVLVGIGGLGHIGLQALHAISPAKTIAVDVKDEALSLAESVGATHTVNAADEDAVAVVDDLTDGVGARKVVDFVGSDETLQYAPAMLRTGGDHHVVGYAGELTVPAQALVGMEIDFRGTLVGSYTELQELITLAEEGLITVETSTHDLEEINGIARRLHDGEIEGRAIFTP